MEQISIVDKDDVVIGSKLPDDILLEDIIRVSSLWITDAKGNILLAQRSLSKTHNPGKWGPAVSGKNAVGETYIDCITREAAEEIGVKLVNFKPVQKVFTVSKSGPYFAQWFATVIDKNTAFKPKKGEVEELGWFSKEDVVMLLREMPEMFVSSAPKVWSDLFLQ